MTDESRLAQRCRDRVLTPTERQDNLRAIKRTATCVGYIDVRRHLISVVRSGPTRVRHAEGNSVLDVARVGRIDRGVVVALLSRAKYLPHILQYLGEYYPR